jgi:hypothetical protein
MQFLPGNQIKTNLNLIPIAIGFPAKHPPGTENKGHVRMVRLEIDAVKI